MLAIQIGMRPAARELGLNEETVAARSAREGWFKVPEPPTVRKASNASKSPADALTAIGERSKLALAKAGEKAANHFNKLSGREVAKQSGAYKNVIDGASKLHGWDTRFQGESFNLNVLNLGGVVSIDTPDK